MIFKSIANAIKQSVVQIVRNRAMSVASLFSITAMLLILGLFFILVVNINMITESARQQFDTIQVYLLDETAEDEALEMVNRLGNMDEVSKAEYLTKDQALEEYKVKWGDKAYLLEGLAENPLPNSIRIKVSNIENADAVVEKAESFSGVEDIKYYQTTVEKLIRITNMIQWGALIIILFLIFISIVVVSNTIKLTVLAREREISIMKYVGADNWYIRGPFLVEGILIGIISAGISSALIGLIYGKISELVGDEAFLILSTAMVPEAFLVKNLIIIFLALGVSIGAFGSIVSMRRFLGR